MMWSWHGSTVQGSRPDPISPAEQPPIGSQCLGLHDCSLHVHVRIQASSEGSSYVSVTDTDIADAVLPEGWTELDYRAIDTIRVLAADAVQNVGNGHPGTAMSLAPVAYLLFQKVMRHNPSDTH